MKPPFLRTPYNYDTDKASDESGLKCLDKSRTQQSYTEEADINYIVKQFGLTGQLPQVQAPVYADYTGITDFQSAQNAIRQAQEEFMQLPAHIRAKFDNDPQRLLEFVADDKNYEAAEAMGILYPEAVQERRRKAKEDALAKQHAEDQRLLEAQQRLAKKAEPPAKKDT